MESDKGYVRSRAERWRELPLAEKISILGGTSSFVCALEVIRRAIASTEPWFPILTGLAFLLLAYQLLRYGTRPVSRVLRPEALQLRVNSPASLIGRSSDVQSVLRLCDDHSLIRLIGPSGVGKTSLVEYGVIPAMKSENSFLPLYLRSWGRDWEKGPRESLAQSIDRAGALGTPPRAAIAQRTPPGQIARVIRALRKSTGKKVALVLDQFDEYLVEHRAMLYRPELHQWISSAELVETNTFWKDIESLHHNGHLHLIFVCKDDIQDGLRIADFGQGPAFRLDPLPSTYVRQVLHEIAHRKSGEQVISNPKHGWDDLQMALENDMQSTGGFLPIRLRMLLEALPALPRLDLRSYRRVGGAEGLEALYIRHQAYALGTHAGITKADVVRILSQFVGDSTGWRESSGAGGATSSRRESAQSTRVSSALQELVRRGLIRRRFESETGEEEYVLAHEYLSAPLEKFLMQETSWSQRLVKRVEAFDRVPWNQIRAKYEKLVPPRDVVPTLWRIATRPSRVHLPWRFLSLSIARAACLALVPVIAYGLAADAGIQMPGGRTVRAAGDMLGVTLFRQVPSDEALTGKTIVFRNELTKELMSRIQDDGWVRTPKHAEDHQDPWTTGQLLSAVLYQPELSDSDLKKCIDSLGTLFRSKTLKTGEDGIEYGWSTLGGTDNAVADPTLWVTRAVVTALARHAPPSEDAELKGWLLRCGSMIGAYWPDRTVGLTPFPRQQVSEGVSSYSSILALDIFSIARLADLSFGPSQDLDSSIDSLVNWIAAQFHSGPSVSGWKIDAGARDDQVGDGLTLQIYTTLLGVVPDQSHPDALQLPLSIIESVFPHLEAIHERPSDYPMDRGMWRDFFVSHKGQLTRQVHNVSYAWLPWSLSCAGRLLVRLESDHSAIARWKRRQIRRVVHSLLEYHVTDIVKNCADRASYELAELLICLTDLEQATDSWIEVATSGEAPVER